MPTQDAPEHAPADATTPLHNRLGSQTSPYLLQHQHNPVPWQPWDDQALQLARQLQRPILLSVGYATCYWCHVMERESFEDPAIGDLLARTVVPIKLDREQRPDLDDLYMNATQLLARQGGWPMNVWLTPPGTRSDDDPGLEPFYAGTYFPPRDAHGMPAFRRVVEGINNAWRNERDTVLAQADSLTIALREHLEESPPPARIDDATVGAAIDVLLRTHDDTNGGFGGAPKFPTPTNAELLLEAGPWINEDAHKQHAQRALRTTLDAMATKGLHDHLDGGFHRYAVDQTWTVPHFEKMLYDNARLATLYAAAYRTTNDPLDLATAHKTCAWALRRMLDPNTNLFFSAIDAEVNAREGLNYLWQPEHIDALDTDDHLKQLATRIFNLDAAPNFKDPHHPNDPPAFVLNLAKRPDQLAAQLGLDTAAFDAQFEQLRAAMLAARDQREQPTVDDKSITAWNALMIEGLATTAAADPTHPNADALLTAAERTTDAVYTTLRNTDGAFLRSARLGTPDPTPAFFEDHAYLLAALVALHHAATLLNRPNPLHLNRAEQLIEQTVNTFGTGSLNATMLDAPKDATGLLARARTVHDGATPSPIGVWINALHDLHQLTNNRHHHERAVACLAAVSAQLRDHPASCAGLARALLRLLQIDANLPDKVADAEPDAADSPVTILTNQSAITIAPNTSTSIPLRIEIAEGYHINAADLTPAAADMGLIPLSARIEGSTALTADLAPADPTTLEPAFLDDDEDNPQDTSIHVHEGTVETTLTITRNDQPLASPTIVVEFQACTDTACYRPIAVALDLTITDPE